MTRPEPAASATAERLRALGFVPVSASLLEIVTLPADVPPPGALRAILVTSGNALPALPPSHAGLPLFAVGDATAARAAAAGFASVESAAGDAAGLAALVRQRLKPEGAPLLLASGEGQGESLADALAAAGYAVIRREVYAARPVCAMPEPARAALAGGTLHAAMFFSAETARAFVRLIEAPVSVAAVEALAIGPAAGVALGALPWRAIRVAARPNQDEMLALLR